MAIKTAPYLDGDKWTIDVDPDDELFYVWNVSAWLTDNSTSTASFELVPLGVTVLQKGTPQGDRSSLLPAKLKVGGPASPQPYCTARVTTADSQKFDKTIYFKLVSN